MLTILAKSATSMTQKSGNSLPVLKRGPEDKRSSAHTHMLHSRKYTKSCSTRKQNKSLQKMTYFAGKEGKNTKTQRETRERERERERSKGFIFFMIIPYCPRSLPYSDAWILIELHPPLSLARLSMDRIPRLSFTVLHPRRSHYFI